MARTKKTSGVTEALNFVKSIEFQEDFLFWHIDKNRWCVGYKSIEDIDSYKIMFHDSDGEKFELAHTYVGKNSDEMDDYVRLCTKLEEEPNYD